MKTTHRNAAHVKRQLQALQSNPVARAVYNSRKAQAEQEQTQAAAEFEARILRDVRGLQLDAGVHTWTSNDASRMVNLAGRLVFIVAHAAIEAGVSADNPDVRIMRGMSEALGDLVDHLDDLERHRRSIQSGLAAIDRLMPFCAAMDLLKGSWKLDEMLNATRQMTTRDVEMAMGVAA